jgi:hypothetical protein
VDRPGIADSMLGTDSFLLNTQRVTLDETTLHDDDGVPHHRRGWA